MTIEVPQIDGQIGGATKNVFEGKSIEVTFAPSGGPANGCTTTTATYTINAAGAAVGTAPSLVNQVGGTGPPCEYAVTFASQDTGSPAQLAKRAGVATDDNVVAGAANPADVDDAAMASYATTLITGQLVFETTTPPHQRTDVRLNVYHQNAEDAPSSCGMLLDPFSAIVASLLRQNYALEADGSSRYPEVYVDFPAGSTTTSDRCSYDLTWDPSETPSGGASAEWVLDQHDAHYANTGLPGAAQTVRATYIEAPDTLFIPLVSVTVPPIDANIGGVIKNVYSDVLTHQAGNERTYEPLRFEITFERSAGPETGCSSDSVIYTVGTDGRTTGGSVNLIDQIGGRGERCVYQVRFPQNDNNYGLLRLTDESFDDSVSGGTEASKQATARYSSSAVRGTFDIEVTSPAYTGAARSVTMTMSAAAGQDSDCTLENDNFDRVTSETRTIVLDADGVTNASIYFTDLPEGAVVESDRCLYDVVWSPSPTGIPAGDTQWEFKRGHTTWSGTDSGRLQTGEPATIRAAYGAPDTFFVSEVSVAVPQIDALIDGADKNVYSDVRSPGVGVTHQPLTFDISFSRSSGPDTGCSQDSTTFTVGADGVVTGTVPRLVDQVSGSGARCVYEVGFPPGGSVAGLVGLSDESFDNTVSGASAASKQASATYVGQAVRGTFNIEVTAPPYTGAPRSLAVTMRPAVGQDDDCTIEDDDSNTVTSLAKTLELDASGTTSSSVFLTDVPDGARVTGDRCRYEVIWSTAPTGIPASETQWEFKTGDASWSGTDAGRLQLGEPATIRATYGEVVQLSPATDFEATLVLLNANDLDAGTIIAAGINPASGVAPGCVVPLSHRRVELVAGPELLLSERFDLVDYAAGATDPCTYDVVWPPNEDGGSNKYIEDPAHAANKGVVLSSARPVAENRYIANPDAVSDDPEPGDNPQPGDDAPPDEPQLGDDPPPDAPQPGEPQPGDGNTGNANPPVNPPVSPPVNPPSATPGGSPRPSVSRSSGGGGGGRTSSGGGGSASSGAGSGGGGTSGGGGSATGPWVVAATSRVPVAVSLEMQAEVTFPVGTAIEVMLNVPGECGDDLTAFAGLPAEVGLVYALNARSGTTAEVLAANALQLAGYAERGDETRDCEVRITLISAPAGCRLESTGADLVSNGSVGTDDAGRTYVELAGGANLVSYAATPRLTCS